MIRGLSDENLDVLNYHDLSVRGNVLRKSKTKKVAKELRERIGELIRPLLDEVPFPMAVIDAQVVRM